MINIHAWKVRDSLGTIYAQVLSCVPAVTGGKATHRALNGATYIQSIGSPSEKIAVQIYAESLLNKLELDTMNCEGKVAYIEYRNIVYIGYILENDISWTPIIPGETYTGNFTLLVDHTVPGSEAVRP